MTARDLPVKIVYTISPSPHPVVARSKRVPITVISLPDGVDSKTRVEYGKVSLKHCLRAVCDSSPELVFDHKRDFTVYVLDPLEQASTLLTASSSAEPKLQGAGAAVGMGLMSWCLAQDEDEDDEADTLHVLGRLITHPASGEMVEVIISLHETSSRVQRGESVQSWATATAKPSQRPGATAPTKRSLPTPRNTSSPAPSAQRDVVDLTDDSRSKKKPADAKKVPPPNMPRPAHQSSTPAPQNSSKPRPGAIPPGPSPMPHPYPYPSYPAYYVSAYHGEVPPPYMRPYPFAYYPPPPGSIPADSMHATAPRPINMASNPPPGPPKPKAKATTNTNTTGRRSATPSTQKDGLRSAAPIQPARSSSQPVQRPATPSSSSGPKASKVPHVTPAPPLSVPSQIVDLTASKPVEPEPAITRNRKRPLEDHDDDAIPRKKLNSDDRDTHSDIELPKADHPLPCTPKLAKRKVLASSPLFSPERADTSLILPVTPARNVMPRIFGSGTGAPLDGLFDGAVSFSPLRDTPGTAACLIEMGFADMLSSSPIARVTSQGLSPWSHLQREMALLPPSSPLPPTSSPTRAMSGNPLDDDDDDDAPSSGGGPMIVKQEVLADQLPLQSPSEPSPVPPVAVDPDIADLENEFSEQNLWAGLGPLIKDMQSSPQRAQNAQG